MPFYFNKRLAEFLSLSSFHKDKWIIELPDKLYISLIAEHKRLIDRDTLISERKSLCLEKEYQRINIAENNYMP